MCATAVPAGRAADLPPRQELTAVNSLPPGNSGFVSLQGQVQGTTGNGTSDFGPHLDDQRETYWSFGYKPGSFQPPTGTPEEPKPGVRIYRDDYGIPAVYGDTGRDVWWGAGYAAAQDRLFLMDAVRRTAEGRLSELTGEAGVPADVQQRVLGYTAAEYDAMFAAFTPEGRDAVEGYVEGANAWRATAMADPRLLPAEYALLTSLPEPFTVHGVLAGGVYITRFVAAEGGNEMRNVAALRELEQQLGKTGGRGAFQDLVWQDDPKAVTTVPVAEGRFSNQPPPPAGQTRAGLFDDLADYAATLPLELAAGPGTGAYPAPVTVPEPPAAPVSKSASARAAQAVVDYLTTLRGGSLAFAVAPSRTADGHAKLLSGPQLGYSYPSLLWEHEVHGGGYDARGVSVPGLPTIGIGYGTRVAWGLTTGYSKTIDSFIETTRPNPAGGPDQYLHNGTWRDQECRDETVNYRPAPQGVPSGPPALSVTVPVCRTVHGPVVATADGLARSVQYAMWKAELKTIDGVLGWNRAKNLAEFRRYMAMVTWNENTTYADADGHIAYWHPGRYPRRSPLVDQRLPVPGTGAYDSTGYLSFDEMPHVEDPAQGFIANWNTKPAVGWLDGEGMGDTSRPGGAHQRNQNLVTQLGARRDFTMAGVQAVDRIAGTTDVRYRAFRPLLAATRATTPLTPPQRAALDLVLAWEGTHFGPGAGTAADGTDGPAPTVFGAWVEGLRRDLFGQLPPTLVTRMAGVGSHRFDMPPLDNLALRILEPGSSGLPVSRDYRRARTPAQVVVAALDLALAQLADTYGSAELSAYRRTHPVSNVCSLTGGVIGPCLTMPYVDRGSWIHVVDFTGPARRPPAAPKPSGQPLPATGLPAAMPLAGSALLLASAWALRRRAAASPR